MAKSKASKQYKNVYTILEKIKKGEIETHYKDSEGLFGKVNFYKKPDLIKPHLHYLDEYKLDNIMSDYVNNVSELKKTYEKFSKSSDYGKLESDKKPNINEFQKKLLDVYKTKFPKHLSKDIFKMYYDKIEKLDFEERSEKNHMKYKFLEHSNNPIGKIMSESSQLKSAIFMKNIVGYYLTQLVMLEYTDPDAANDLVDNLKDGDADGNQKAEDIMKKMLDGKLSKNMLDDAISDAKKTCETLDNSLDDEQQEQMFNDCATGGGGASKLDGNYIENISKKIESIKLSMGSLKEKIKKLMDKSMSYFSAKEEATYTDLFNADDVAGIDDYLYLHPRLRKVLIEDVVVKETKKVGKIDIYIDISGSMSSGCGVANTEGREISKLDFCKSFVNKLREMDILNNVYTFENRVKQIKSDIITIALLSETGGTDIDKAVNMIKTNGINALVITDAEDDCSIYSEKAFFIGVKGCNFRSFKSAAIKEYSNANQVIVFDGNLIQRVDTQGYVVK